MASSFVEHAGESKVIAKYRIGEVIKMGYALNIKPTIQKEGMTKNQFIQSLNDMDRQVVMIDKSLSLQIKQVIQDYYYDSANILNSISQKYG